MQLSTYIRDRYFGKKIRIIFVVVFVNKNDLSLLALEKKQIKKYLLQT
jgi:hypothetical protein